MRKMFAAELIVLATVLTANGGTLADETKTLPTVSVTGQYNTIPIFTIPAGIYPGTGTIPTPYVSGTNSNSYQSYTYHAMACAAAYAASFPGGGTGPKPGMQTWVVSNYGWIDLTSNKQYDPITATKPVVPAGDVLVPVQGYTMPGVGSFVYTPNISGTAALVDAIAHEWSHQWGSLDLNNGAPNDAYAIGDKAKAAYLADKGAKCGGL